MFPYYICEHCGDGIISGTETCDDDNSGTGDGCDNNCDVETGYKCEDDRLGSTCVWACGEGIVDTGEFCDDNNTANLDGCDDTCVVEDGWTCDGASPSACDGTCGDMY